MKHTVQEKEILKWKADKKIRKFLECSAMTGENVLDIFNSLASEITKKDKKGCSGFKSYDVNEFLEIKT